MLKKQMGDGILLKHLNAPWREVLPLASRCTFAKNHKLAISPASFYYIESGQVRLGFIGDSGLELLICFVSEGCLCGDLALTLAPRRSTMLCTTPVIAWRFDKELLRNTDFIREHPLLLYNVIESSSAKLSNLANLAFGVTTHTPVWRLASFFLDLAHTQQNTSLCPGVTHEELSAHLAMHRSTLTRALIYLRSHGIIGSFTKKRLEILDITQLKNITNGIW